MTPHVITSATIAARLDSSLKTKPQFRFFLLSGSLAATLAGSLSAFGWGKTGHEIVAEVGSELSSATRFYAVNVQAMRVHTNTPDNVWKAGENRNAESTNHWFEPDSYTDDTAEFPAFPRQYSRALAAHGREKLDKNGTAPWRILQTYDQALEALRGKNWVRALQMAGVMSHYIGDLSQPLHVTNNFDGQLTDQKGIHAYFESSNLGKFPREELKTKVLARARQLLADKNFLRDFSGKLVDIGFLEVLRSYTDKDDVLDTDRQLGRSGAGSKAQIEIAIRRMADGAATLALVLDRLWLGSGLRDSPAASVEVPVPAFLQPSFYDEGAARNRILRRALAEFSVEGHAAASESHDEHDCLAP